MSEGTFAGAWLSGARTAKCHPMTVQVASVRIADVWGSGTIDGGRFLDEA